MALIPEITKDDLDKAMEFIYKNHEETKTKKLPILHISTNIPIWTTYIIDENGELDKLRLDEKLEVDSYFDVSKFIAARNITDPSDL